MASKPSSNILSRRQPGLHRVAALLTLVALTSAADFHGASAAQDPDFCESLDSIPTRFDIDYEHDVQPIFDARCSNCHVNSSGNPSAGMELDPDVSWFQLVEVPSSQDPSLTRVRPFLPNVSLLFQKVNCDVPGYGSRMPFERTPLSLAEQAIIHDWIATGASITTGETIFFAGFEDRP